MLFTHNKLFRNVPFDPLKNQKTKDFAMFLGDSRRNIEKKWLQKQLTRCVLKKRCSEKMQQIYRRAPMSKCNFNKFANNFIEIALQQGCSPVNLLHIFKTPFLKSTSGLLLLCVNNYNLPQAYNFVKKQTLAGVFLWNLRNFKEHLLLKNTSVGCLCRISMIYCIQEYTAEYTMTVATRIYSWVHYDSCYKNIQLSTLWQLLQKYTAEYTMTVTTRIYSWIHYDSCYRKTWLAVIRNNKYYIRIDS